MMALARKQGCVSMHSSWPGLTRPSSSAAGAGSQRMPGTSPGTTVLRCLAQAAALSLGVASAYAGDVKAGREAAQVCAPCHGMDGLSKAMNAANIAGQLELYLVEQLKAYRSGARKHEQMSIVAETLTDKEIADLAAYYSAIKVQVTVPK